MNYKKPYIPLLGSLLLGTLFAHSVAAKTICFPHVLEKSGRISAVSDTFDTTLFITYSPSLSPSSKDTNSAHVELYLYDETTGQLMVGAGGTPVCGPCMFDLNAQNRKVSVSLDDLIVNRGGGFDNQLKTGFAVLLTSGSGTNAVNCELMVENVHTNQNELSVFGFDPVPIEASAISLPPGTPQPRRTYSFPHVLETSGRAASAPYSFDTTLFATYTGGLPGMSTGSTATVQLYLYDQTGQPMTATGGTAVCNPCNFDLGTGGGGSASPRKRTIIIDDLITAAGGFDTTNKVGFAVVAVGGDDPGAVNLQGFVVNSHSGPFDVSMFPFDPPVIKTNSGPSPKRTWVIPHILEKSGLVATQTFTFDTTIFATYTAGLADMPPGPGATLDFYLYDDSGELMRGNNGTVVCGPCSYNLSAQQRKQSVRIDDLITTRGGGFDTTSKSGFGVIVVGGGDPDGVNLQSFVVNSHTSAFDLSVFGFDPVPIAAATVARPAPPEPAPKAFVIPHVLEKSGLTTGTPFTFDTTIFATYVGGLSDTISSNGATVKLYLYDESGQFMKGAGGIDVCGPCMFDLNTSSRKQSIRIDDLIVSNGGGFDAATKLGYGILVVGGNDPDAVNLQGFVVNSHTSAFDLSVFGFEPQPIAAARQVPMPVVIIDPTLIAVPTVIGGRYTVEGKASLEDPTWSSVKTFEGDGTVQTISLAPSPTGQQFLRVKGN